MVSLQSVPRPASVLLLVMMCVVESQPDVSVNYTPMSVCALKGSTVTMGCIYFSSFNNATRVFWSKEESFLKEPPDLSLDPDYTGRVQYVTQSWGLYKLRLSNVAKQDQRKYYAVVIPRNGNILQGKGGVNLSVTELRVEVHPDSVLEGDDVTLTCRTTCSLTDTPIFIWYKRGRLVYSKYRSDQLHLPSVSQKDAGSYSCAAGLRSYTSPAASLTVHYPPRSVSVSISPSGEVVEGSWVTLTCNSDANPPVLIYTWYKGTSFIRTGQSYTIDRIRPEDSGEYKCMAENRYGERYSVGVTLKVLEPPKKVTVSISPSGEIQEGSTVTLTCSSDANLPAEISWFKGTSHIATAKTYIIPKISSEDSGDYKCKSSNRYGWKYSDQLTVKVVYPPKSVSVSISPSGEVVEGSSVTLTCSSDANPPVQTYTWYMGTSFVGKGKTYTVKKIRSKDSGDYWCKSSHPYGENFSSVTLNVLHRPKSVSVSITASSEIVDGGSVALTCSSDANPPVQTYTWYKVNESSPVGSGQSYSFTLSSSSSGWFYCVAQNKYGTQRAAAVPLTFNQSLPSDYGLSSPILGAAVAVCGVCVVGVIVAGILCVRRKRRKRKAVKSQQDAGPHAEEGTYTSLEAMTRSSSDVYTTLALQPRPPDDTYAALDPKSISSDYDTLTEQRKHR